MGWVKERGMQVEERGTEPVHIQKQGNTNMMEGKRERDIVFISNTKTRNEIIFLKNQKQKQRQIPRCVIHFKTAIRFSDHSSTNLVLCEKRKRDPRMERERERGRERLRKRERDKERGREREIDGG